MAAAAPKPTTFEGEPYLLTDEENALLPEGAAHNKPKHCTYSKNLLMLAICTLWMLAVCVTVLVVSFAAMGRIEASVYSRIDPVIEHLEPTMKSARKFMANLEATEQSLSQEVNRTYHNMVRSVPAVTKANDMLEDTSKLLHSVAHTMEHPRLHIDIDGNPP